MTLFDPRARTLPPMWVGFLVVAAAACRRPEDVAPLPDPAVLTMMAHAHPEPALARRGVVTAGSRLRLGFNAAGVIASIRVKTGDAVQKGDLLARLKDGDATAALQAAQAVRLRALRDYNSADTLAQSGAVASAQRDDARSALHVATANTSLAEESLGQRQLLSPISGSVLQRLAEPGEAVGPGMPVLVLEGTHRLVVRVGVTERELARVRTNQVASLVVDGTEVQVAGSVTSIAPAPSEDGLYAVEVSPGEQQNAPFRSGTLLTVRFEDERAEAAVRIPLDALVHRDDKAYVFVTEGAQSPAKVTLRELKVDRADGKEVLVRDGLKDGERFVREGGQFLNDGQLVRLLD